MADCLGSRLSDKTRHLNDPDLLADTQLTSGFSFMLICRTTTGKWVIGESLDTIWFTDAPSIEAARKRYSRSGGLPLDNRWPKLENGMYLIPDEFTPLTLRVAKLFNTRFYVGNACKYHPLNHIRMTSTKNCCVCRILEQKGCKSLY